MEKLGHLESILGVLAVFFSFSSSLPLSGHREVKNLTSCAFHSHDGPFVLLLLFLRL